MLFSGTYSFWLSLVDQHRVALAERAALGVLAGQADASAFQQQAAEAERLAGRPVDALAGVDGICALASSWRAIFGLRLKPSGTCDSAAPICFSVSVGDARWVPRCVDFLLIGRVKAGPVAFQPVGLVRLVGFAPRSWRPPASW